MDVMNLIPWTHFAKISETMKLQIQGFFFFFFFFFTEV